MSTRPGAASVAAAVLVVAAGLAGCASAGPGPHAATAAKTGAGKTGAAGTAARVSRPVGPPAGSQAEADTFAARMLSAVILPAGAKRLPLPQEPAYFSHTLMGRLVQTGTAASPYRLYRMPVPMSAAIAFVQAHLPAGEVNPASGKELGNGDATVETYVDVSARRVPAGIAQGELEYSVVPARGGRSVLLVYAQVSWYPPRPAAEDFTAASFSAVTLSADSGHGKTVEKTLSSPQLIGEIVGLLDSLHVSTTPPTSCGLLNGNGSIVELRPVSSSQPPVYAESSCGGYQIHLGTTQEPTLQGPDTKLDSLVARLLAVPAGNG